MGGGLQGLNPIRGRHGGLEEERANDVVHAPDHTLGTAILGGCIGAGHAKVNAVSAKKCARARVVELFAIVALDGFDRSPKLCVHKGEEVSESRKSVGFQP